MQEEEKQPNPVVQRVKIIMALGLAVMHLHSWFFSQLIGLSLGGLPPSFEDNEGVSGVGGLSEETAEGEEGGGGGGGGREKVSMMEFLWLKVFHLSGDQVHTHTHTHTHTEVEITVGHRTFSVHFLRVSEQKSIWSV